MPNRAPDLRAQIFGHRKNGAAASSIQTAHSLKANEDYYQTRYKLFTSLTLLEKSISN